MIGDVAVAPSGESSVHVHLVVGRRGVGGHLGSAQGRPTLELIITESPVHLRKVKDAVSGLAPDVSGRVCRLIN